MPKITMPKLSDTMTEGTLLRWCKQQGDLISIGDVLAEVETDKATMEMEAFEEGTLSEIYVPAGSKVIVGSPIALILGKNESTPSKEESSSTHQSTASSTPSQERELPGLPFLGKGARSHSFSPLAKKTSTESVRIKATPLAKKIAQSRHLSLEKMIGRGTGPGGRIVAKDVLEAPTSLFTGESPSSSIKPILPTSITGNPDQQIPLTSMRKVIAERLLASKTQIPHFYLSLEIDAAPMMEFRKEFNSQGAKITFNDLVLLATAKAALLHPAINAAFGEGVLFQYEQVNLAVAIAIEEGLVTPVIKNAAALSLLEISAAVKDLATRARNKKLKPEEFSGGTITVSNLGAYGIDQFCAIINPPQAAILAVGAIVKKPVINTLDQIVPGHRLNLTLSGDHRVIDGAVAATYLSTLKGFLEAPSKLLL